MSQIPAPTPTPFPSDQIKEIVHTEVEKILKEVKASFVDKPALAANGALRSYVEAAAKGRLFTALGELRVHPRAMREVTFRVPTANTDARTLTSAQIVQKAKAATCSSSVLAARRLPSGDVVLLFDTESSKDQLIDNIALRSVFGPDAAPIQRGFPVTAFGFPRSLVESLKNEELAALLRKENPNWLGAVQLLRAVCTAGTKKRSGSLLSLVLVFATPQQANSVIDEGVLFESQLHNAEPLFPECQVRRCFRCQGYHKSTARLCQRSVRCGWCCAPHSTQGCSVRGTARPSCAACGKKGHAAWALECLVRIREQERAKAAWLTRPRRFEVRAPQPARSNLVPPPATSSTPAAALPPLQTPLSGSLQKRSRPSSLKAAVLST